MSYIKSFLYSLPFLFSACATTAGYKQVVATWIDHDSSELVSTWGEPLTILPQPGGASRYVYSRASSSTMPGFYQPIPVTNYHNGTISAYGTNGYNTAYVNGTTTGTAYIPTGPITVSSYCVTKFDVNAAGKISFVSFEGNGCKQ